MVVNFKTTVKKHQNWKTNMYQLDYSTILKEFLHNVDLKSDGLDIGYDEINGVGVIYSGDVIAGTFSVDRKINCTCGL